MRTITLDILDDKALNMLKDMERLKIIRVRRVTKPGNLRSDNLIAKYKGVMTPQPIQEIDKQLNDLRNEWR